MNLSELRDRPHWSYSSLNQLLNICSLQWFYDRILKLPRPFVSHALVFGTCVHRVLDRHHKALMAGGKPDPAEAVEEFGSLWQEACATQEIKFPKTESAESLAEKGRGVAGCFLENIDPGERILAVGQAFAVPVHTPDGRIAELPLVGEFDLVVERGGEPVIVDWKTAGRRWSGNQAHKNLQATAYSHAWHQLHGFRPEIRFDVAVKNKTPVFERHPTRRTALQEQRLTALIAAAENIIAGEMFYPAEQSNYCGDCPFRTECEAWHLAAA